MSSDSTPPETPFARPLTFFSAAIWTLIALMVFSVIVGVTEQGREGATIDLVSRTGVQALAYSLVFFGILRLHEPESSIRHVLGLRAPSVPAIVLAAAVGAALSLPSDWLDNALAARWPTDPQDAEAVQSVLAVTTVGKKVSLFLTLVLVQPTLTELFFRGAIFTPLRRTSRTELVVLAVAAFESLNNMSVRATIAFLAATLVFSWVRGATGSVIPAIVAHVVFNGVSVVPLCLGRSELTPTKPLLLASGVVALASIFGLSMVSRTARAVDARQRDAGEVPL